MRRRLFGRGQYCVFVVGLSVSLTIMLVISHGKGHDTQSTGRSTKIHSVQVDAVVHFKEAYSIAPPDGKYIVTAVFGQYPLTSLMSLTWHHDLGRGNTVVILSLVAGGISVANMLVNVILLRSILDHHA